MSFPNLRWKPEPELMGAMPEERLQPVSGSSKRLMFAEISGAGTTTVMETGETHEPDKGRPGPKKK